LTDESRMIRMVETLDLFNVRRGRQTVELDVAVPDVPGRSHMLIPAVFLNKRPVAPDLEVHAADGSMVSVPTKHENQELTLAALDELHNGGFIDLDLHPEMRTIVGDIVCMRPVVAEVAGIQLRSRVPDLPPFLARLLELLEEKFLLWIPLEGVGGGTHYFSIQRRLHREIEPIIPRKAEMIEVEFEMAVGPTTVIGPSAIGGRTIRPLECFERLLRILGLAPIQVAQELIEACRVDSYHARVRSPEDFVVRDVRLARILNNRGTNLRLEELESEPNQVIQGHDSEIAHINCVRRTDHTPMLLEVLLGIRDGLTTLWTLGVVMTAVLLWIFKHDPAPATDSGHLDVAAAILLLGPALAAAWVVRSDEGDLLRNVLSGTRQLLMGSALLSVAAALALIGYAPFGLSVGHALEWYAGGSYAVAVIVAISWSITRQTPWIFYRYLLSSPRRNLVATTVLSATAAGVVAHGGIPTVATGISLLAGGIALAVISANRAGCEMGGPRRPFAPLAGLAAGAALLAAGAFLGYYEDVLSFHVIRPVLCAIEDLLAVLALVSLAGRDYDRPVL
jgi:hypothetical protein